VRQAALGHQVAGQARAASRRRPAAATPAPASRSPSRRPRSPGCGTRPPAGRAGWGSAGRGCRCPPRRAGRCPRAARRRPARRTRRGRGDQPGVVLPRVAPATARRAAVVPGQMSCSLRFGTALHGQINRLRNGGCLRIVTGVDLRFIPDGTPPAVCQPGACRPHRCHRRDPAGSRSRCGQIA
jgi:hypothetical protein